MKYTNFIVSLVIGTNTTAIVQRQLLLQTYIHTHTHIYNIY